MNAFGVEGHPSHALLLPRKYVIGLAVHTVAHTCSTKKLNGEISQSYDSHRDALERLLLLTCSGARSTLAGFCRPDLNQRTADHDEDEFVSVNTSSQQLDN